MNPELLGLLGDFLKLPENIVKLSALFVDAGYPQDHVDRILRQTLVMPPPPSEQKGDSHA